MKLPDSCWQTVFLVKAIGYRFDTYAKPLISLYGIYKIKYWRYHNEQKSLPWRNKTNFGNKPTKTSYSRVGWALEATSYMSNGVFCNQSYIKWGNARNHKMCIRDSPTTVCSTSRFMYSPMWHLLWKLDHDALTTWPHCRVEYSYTRLHCNSLLNKHL